MVIIDVEYTDTYAGKANYGWVCCAMLDIPEGLTDRAIMRRAKKAVGISGLRGRTYTSGDSAEFRPYGMCTVLFWRVRY